MSRYRRLKIEGGAFFFTLALADRGSDLLVRHVERLRRAYAAVEKRQPFETVAICVLPDHIHAEKLTLKAEIFPGLSVSVQMISQPQADSERVGRLAFYHVTAFHYFMTYKKDTRIGEAIYGQFAVAGDYRHLDWGNERACEFMQITRGWNPRFVIKGKDAYFKVIIRRRLPDFIWSWALEWNQSFRVFGFYGDGKLVEQALADLPLLEAEPLASDSNRSVRMRKEITLAEANDILFDHEIPPAA